MKKLITTCSLLLCLTACVADSTSDDNTADAFLEVGSVAPDFMIYTSDNPEGFPLSSLQGKYVMIEFWASWCPDCRKVTEEMKDMYSTYASDNITFLGVSFDTSEETWRNYITENNMSWLQFCEFKEWKESTISTAYNVKWIPTFYLIDPTGHIAYGTITIADMKEKLQEISSTKQE